MANLSKTFGLSGSLLLVLLAISFSALPALGQYGGGSGTAEDPYLIYTPAQMNTIGAMLLDWDKHFRLMADIDLSAYTGTSFNIIGPDTDDSTVGFQGTPFTGVFDGNGHTISNFKYISTGRDFIGIFGHVDDPNAETKNLGLIEPNVDAGSEWGIGSLVGRLTEGVITNCYAKGGNVSGGMNVGGLVGGNIGTISDCYSTASVSGEVRVGGLVGANWKGAITNCYSTGGVSGVDLTGSFVQKVGGLVGENWGEELEVGTIINCYATGSVSGTALEIGGLVGSNRSNSGGVSVSFWDIQTSGQAISDGGMGKTTAQMKDRNTYIGWGCEPVWTIDAGVDYPHLLWEGMPGEIVIDAPKFYGGGSGTENDPYLIFTAEQLNNIGLPACDWDMHFKLMADIDLSAYSDTAFNIIGNGAIEFSGVFGGNGYTVSNFTFSSTGVDSVGFFGYVGENAEIKDLGLIDPNVDGGTAIYVGGLAGTAYGTIANCWIEGGTVFGGVGGGGVSTLPYGGVGGLVGYAYGTISDCRVDGGTVSGSDSRIGGLVGRNSGLITKSSASASVVANGRHIGGLVGRNEGTISNCYSTGSVSGGQFEIGGLVGFNWDSTIRNCYSTATVSGEVRVGGLVGQGSGTISKCYATGSVSGRFAVGGLVGGAVSMITNCYSTGSVSGTERVGGLVGSNGNGVVGTLTNCYSTGSVSGEEDVGGLVGFHQGRTVMSCFWDTETSGQTTSDGGMGLTTAQMQDPSTFITFGGWDFFGESTNGTEDIWRLCSAGTNYPKLTWQFPLSDFVCPDGVDMNDLEILTQAWLTDDSAIDIAPPGGDGIVNFLDFAALANNWLAGL